MSDLHIPGLTEGKFKTDQIIAGLVKAESIPLTRLENTLEANEEKQQIWNQINRKVKKLALSSLQIFGVDNPFRTKQISSTDENILVGTASRNAEIAEYNIKVLQLASNDRIRSDAIAAGYQPSAGKYSFRVGADKFDFNFTGTGLADLVEQINTRGSGILKAVLINSSAAKQILTIAAVKTGRANRLEFLDAAAQFALDLGLVQDGDLANRENLLLEPQIIGLNTADYSLENDILTVNASSELRVNLAPSYKLTQGATLVYELAVQDIPPSQGRPAVPQNVENSPNTPVRENEPGSLANAKEATEIDPKLHGGLKSSDLPEPPGAEYKGISVPSATSDNALKNLSLAAELSGDNGLESGPAIPNVIQEAQPVLPSQVASSTEPKTSNDIIFLDVDGTEYLGPRLPLGGGFHEFKIDLANYKQLDALVIKNANSSRAIKIRNIHIVNDKLVGDFLFKNPISTARDSIINYEGVESSRGTNNIDDLIPGLSLNLYRSDPTTNVIIDVRPNYENISDAVTKFIIDYNDLMTDLNIVSSLKSDVVEEKIDFTAEERSQALARLGKLQDDSSISNLQFNLRQLIGQSFPTLEGNLPMARIGISTNASALGSGLSRSKLRGYLEMDTDIFLDAMENNIELVKDIFGRDNNGDFIIDSGLAFSIQNLVNNYSATGGPINYKINSLDNLIERNNQDISDYKIHLEDFERDMRIKYGKMEGLLYELETSNTSLNSLNNSDN